MLQVEEKHLDCSAKLFDNCRQVVKVRGRRLFEASLDVFSSRITLFEKVIRASALPVS